MDKPLTNKSVTKIVKTESINALHDFYEQILEPKFNSIDKKLSKHNDKLDENTYQIKQVKKSVDDIKADIASTPTRKEFNTLRTKVDSHHPAL